MKISHDNKCYYYLWIFSQTFNKYGSTSSVFTWYDTVLLFLFQRLKLPYLGHRFVSTYHKEKKILYQFWKGFTEAYFDGWGEKMAYVHCSQGDSFQGDAIKWYILFWVLFAHSSIIKSSNTFYWIEKCRFINTD